MTQTIKYIGAQQRWSELPYTGAQSVWAPGQIEERADVDAAALMASGVFEKIQGDLNNVELTDLRALGIAVSTYGFPDAMRASDGYFLRFIAPRTPASADKKAWDNSGNRNDGVFQNHLTAAAAWATAGALTQKNPDTPGEQTLVSFPACNFDLLGGESLLIFWKGRATPEGTDQALMANTVNETTANGFRVVCRSTGQVGFNGYQFSGGISASAPNASTVCFSATVTNSFAICLTGAAGPLTGACNIRIFVNGAPDGATGYTNGFQPFHSGVLMDLAQPTQNFLLGGNGATSGGIQFGVACQTEALHVLKGRVGLGAPLNLTQLVADLHRDPSRLVLASEW